MSILTSAGFLFLTVAKPVWVKLRGFAGPLMERPWIPIIIGAAVIAWPMINNAGRNAVVSDVERQASEIKERDAVENIELAKRYAEIEQKLKEAELELKRANEGAKNETFADESAWARQPLPDSVIKRLQ